MAFRVSATLVVLLLTASACNRSQAEAPAKPGNPPGKAGAPAVVGPRAIPITVGRAEGRAVQRAVETSGSLLAWEEVLAKTEQAGTIAKLFVDLGDRVTAGMTLAEYDRREFQLTVDQAMADLSAARESLSRAQATAAATEASLKRVKDNLASLDAEVARAQSQTDWTRSELERNQQLYAKEIIAARDVDSARNLYNTAAAQLTMMKTALAQHPDQVRVAEAQLRSDLAAVRAAEATVRQREAAVGIVEKRMGDTTVKASIAGFIAKRHVSAGEFVKDNTPLFTIVVINPLKYAGTVPERQAPELKVGQILRLTVEAYPDKTFTGTVTRLAPAVDVATRTLAVEAKVPNDGNALRPGFFAKGSVLTREDPSVVVVPADALMNVVGLNKVFVIADGKAQERHVRPGARQGGTLEILQGVKVGETVATSNLPALYNGASVTVVTR
ncbi:MAG: efflux RND transporter periplasmic adaptor subunit [Candidatus Rokuibacteriota bacterium]